MATTTGTTRTTQGITPNSPFFTPQTLTLTLTLALILVLTEQTETEMIKPSPATGENARRSSRGSRRRENERGHAAQPAGARERDVEERVGRREEGGAQVGEHGVGEGGRQQEAGHQPAVGQVVLQEEPLARGERRVLGGFFGRG